MSTEMTLERAVRILNERKHRDFCRWIETEDFLGHPVAGTDEYRIRLTEFEAIAVVEKYLRESERAEPAEEPPPPKPDDPSPTMLRPCPQCGVPCAYTYTTAFMGPKLNEAYECKSCGTTRVDHAVLDIIADLFSYGIDAIRRSDTFRYADGCRESEGVTFRDKRDGRRYEIVVRPIGGPVTGGETTS